MISSRQLRNNRFIRWLFRNIFVTGDNVRLCVQRPIIRKMVSGGVRRALDAGCGSGEYTRLTLLPRVREVVALDTDSNCLARLGSRLSAADRQRCQLTVGSVAKIAAGDGQFDLVLCAEVLEHCRDDEAVVAELARVLAPGGILIISVPVPPAPLDDPAHVREGYQYEQLRAMLERHGVRCREHEFCMFGLSRGAIRAAARFNRWVQMPLPLMLLCHLERGLQAVGVTVGAPYDLVVRAEK